MKFLWYGVCVLFCIHSLSILRKESYQVTYHSTSMTQGWGKQISYLGCLNLDALYSNETMKITPSQLGNDFAEYVDSIKSVYGSKEYRGLVSKRIRSGDFLVLKNMVCLPENSNENLRKIFGFSTPVLRFAYVKNPLNLLEIKSLKDYFSLLTVVKKEPPYSRCVPGFSKFTCLNECATRGQRLSRYYFYGRNETDQTIYLEANSSTDAHESACAAKCAKTECETNFLIVKSNQDEARWTVYR